MKLFISSLICCNAFLASAIHVGENESDKKKERRKLQQGFPVPPDMPSMNFLPPSDVKVPGDLGSHGFTVAGFPDTDSGNAQGLPVGGFASGVGGVVDSGASNLHIGGPGDSDNDSGDPSNIINGVLAKAGEYPWYSRIMKNSGSQWCGGSLIAENWVLTAAHCFPPGVSGLNVFVGALCMDSYTNCDQKVEAFTIRQVILHPQYDPNGWANDYALIRLNGKSSIAPVQIDNMNLSWGFGSRKPLRVAGFGATTSDGSTYPTKLYHADLGYVPPNECKQMMGSNRIQDNMLCAIGNNQDACYGDSGGPLFDHQSQRLMGLVSWGYGCNIGLPTVFARIASQFDWLRNNVCPNTEKKPEFCGQRMSAKPSCKNEKHRILELEFETDNWAPEDNTVQVFAKKQGTFKKRRINIKKINKRNALFTKYKCLNKNKCYMFVMKDENGDGICCSHGAGKYSLTFDDEPIVINRSFTNQHEDILYFGNC